MLFYSVSSFSEGFIPSPGSEDSFHQLEQEKYILYSHNKKAGLWLTHKKHLTAVEVLDKDNDGTIDLIRYGVFDQDDNQLYEVEDYDMDGQLDQRTTYKDNKTFSWQIWYENHWRLIIIDTSKKPTEWSIEVNEKKIMLTREKGRFIVVSS